MHINGYWLNTTSGELYHDQTKQSWQLSEVEQHVLKLLMQNQGRLLSKAELCVNETMLSAASITQIVERLKNIFDKNQVVIDVKKGRGYLLRSTSKSTLSKNCGTQPLIATPKLISIIILLFFMLGISIYSLNRLPKTAAQIPLMKQEVILGSGENIAVFLHHKKNTNDKTLTQKGTQLASAIARCESSRWQQIHVWLSATQQLEVTPTSNAVKKLGTRYKLDDNELANLSSSLGWLQAQGICN